MGNNRNASARPIWQRHAVRTTLWTMVTAVLASSDVPADWQPRVASSQALFAANDTALAHPPSIGNGFIGTIMGSDTVYIAGVFNGLSSKDPSHRARLPSPLSITVQAPGAVLIGALLDMERAVYYRRTQVDTAVIEQRWYASQTNASVLVMEMQINLGKGESSSQCYEPCRWSLVWTDNKPVTFELQSNAGPLSADIDFKLISQGSGYKQYQGSCNTPEFPGVQPTGVSYVATDVPTKVTADSNIVLTYVMAVRTTLETPVSKLASGKISLLHRCTLLLILLMTMVIRLCSCLEWLQCCFWCWSCATIVSYCCLARYLAIRVLTCSKHCHFFASASSNSLHFFSFGHTDLRSKVVQMSLEQ